MSTETTVEFGVHVPKPRGVLVTEMESEQQRLAVEAMSFEVMEAIRRYDPEGVIAYIGKQLAEMEVRLGVKFSDRSVSIVLPTGGRRDVEIDRFRKDFRSADH